MTLSDKLLELRKLMKYYELVADARSAEPLWIIRNVTDEGIGHGMGGTRVVFRDSDLETIVERALNYAKFGPDKEVLKAAAEVTDIFKRRTLIQGDTISIILSGYDDPDIEKVENKLVDMYFRHGRFDVEPYYFYSPDNDVDDRE